MRTDVQESNKRLNIYITVIFRHKRILTCVTSAHVTEELIPTLLLLLKKKKKLKAEQELYGVRFLSVLNTRK